MNWERFEGRWLQFAGLIGEAWGELRGDPVRAASGRRQQIIGKEHELSAIATEKSALHLKSFLNQHRNWTV